MSVHFHSPVFKVIPAYLASFHAVGGNQLKEVVREPRPLHESDKEKKRIGKEREAEREEQQQQHEIERVLTEMG